MNFKQYTRYQIDFRGKWVMPSALLMGLSFFFRIVYYFGLTNFAACGFGEIVFCMALPILVCGIYIVMLSALKWNAPGVYGILGAILCLLLLIWSFSTGDVLRIVLSVIVYLSAGVVLIATVGGYLPGRLLSSALFFVPLVCRFFFYDLGILGIFDYFLEASVLFMLASLFALTRSLKEAKHKPASKTKE